MVIDWDLIQPELALSTQNRSAQPSKTRPILHVERRVCVVLSDFTSVNRCDTGAKYTKRSIVDKYTKGT